MKLIEILKRANDKLEPVSDIVLTYIENLGDKIPSTVEKNMKKIYVLSILLTLLGMKEGYEQKRIFWNRWRGYDYAYSSNIKVLLRDEKG